MKYDRRGAKCGCVEAWRGNRAEEEGIVCSSRHQRGEGRGAEEDDDDDDDNDDSYGDGDDERDSC